MWKIDRNPTFPLPYAKSVPIPGMRMELSSEDIFLNQLRKELKVITATHQGNLKQLIAAKRDFMGRHFGSDEQIDALVKAYLEKMPKKQNIEDKTNRKRILYIVGGPSGSGKSTLIKRIQKDNPDCAMIDPDELVTFHPKFAMIEALFGKEWGEMATNINVPAREKMIKILAQKGYDICVEGSKTYAKYIPLVLDGTDNNYRVDVYLPIVPPLMLEQRSLKRMADQKKEGQPIRGVTLEEYEDDVTGHIPLGFERAKSFFEDYQHNPDVRVIVPMIDIDGYRQVRIVENFDEYYELYKDVTENTQKAQQHFEKLQGKSKRKHLDRIRATYGMLEAQGILKDAKKYLHTMGVDNTGEKLTAYGQDISVIGKHDDVERTEKDYKRAFSLVESLSMIEDNSKLREQFERVKQKYQQNGVIQPF